MAQANLACNAGAGLEGLEWILRRGTRESSTSGNGLVVWSNYVQKRCLVRGTRHVAFQFQLVFLRLANWRPAASWSRLAVSLSRQTKSANESSSSISVCVRYKRPPVCLRKQTVQARVRVCTVSGTRAATAVTMASPQCI